MLVLSHHPSSDSVPLVLLPLLLWRAVTLQVGCGADELIDLLMRCTLDPGARHRGLPAHLHHVLL